MKIHNFQGDLTDILGGVKKLILMCLAADSEAREYGNASDVPSP